METEHKQRVIDTERQWNVALAEKDRIYENQVKKTEANEFVIRRLEEKLRQKEVQFDIKKGEIKRVLLQYSDLKNEKVKCEKKIGAYVLSILIIAISRDDTVLVLSHIQTPRLPYHAP